MLRPSALLALALSLRLAATSPSSRSLLPRNDFDICPQVGNQVAIPDHNTFQFPLDGFHQNMCWPFSIASPSAPQGSICFDFVQYSWTFTFKAIPGYTYTEADIWWGTNAPTGPVIPQYSTSTKGCQFATDHSTVTCTIPYQDLVGGTTNLDWLHGMCPQGDSQGLFVFFETNALLLGPDGPVTGCGAQSCVDSACSSKGSYWELTYRCSFCQNGESSSSTTPSSTPSSTPCSTTSSTPTWTSCEVGTAMGYGTIPQAIPLNSQNPLPTGCNRWGWYFNPTASQLSAGITGPLYVGAGLNDITKAILVGTWSASLSSSGVSVTYTLQSGYTLAEVHVDLACSISKCAPGQYTYSNSNAAQLGSGYTVSGLTFPTCKSPSKPILIVHAKVNQATTATTCPAPWAT